MIKSLVNLTASSLAGSSPTKTQRLQIIGSSPTLAYCKIRVCLSDSEYFESWASRQYFSERRRRACSHDINVIKHYILRNTEILITYVATTKDDGLVVGNKRLVVHAMINAEGPYEKIHRPPFAIFKGVVTADFNIRVGIKGEQCSFLAGSIHIVQQQALREHPGRRPPVTGCAGPAQPGHRAKCNTGDRVTVERPESRLSEPPEHLAPRKEY